jgi:hypothetical protein
MDYNMQLRITEQFDENLCDLGFQIFGKYKRGLAPYKELNKLRQQALLTKQGKRLISICKVLYKKYGLKVIARELGITYSDARKLFSLAKIEIRKGRSITTDSVKQFRKNKAKYENTNNIGFNSDLIKRKTLDSIKRGVQGYYFNKSKNKQVWLRSTYEWIFAKWLDKTNHIWDTECRLYHIDSRKYRPDFFIFDNENQLIKIIEIKGYWDNNSDKASLLNDLLSSVEVITISDITKFIENNKTYNSELAEWKKLNGKN